MKVAPAGDALVLSIDGCEVERVGCTDVRRLPSDSGDIRLGHRDVEGWRLILAGPVDPALATLLPGRVARDPVLAGWKGRSAVAITAVLTLALGALVLFPYQFARAVPMRWETRLGQAYDLPMDWSRCDDPSAQAALDALVDRLDPTARRDGIRVSLLDVDQINAAALPGQRIVILDGLFAVVDHPDGLAGIVAHELAHVRRRHVAAGMIRQMGIGTLVTLAGGGTAAGAGGNILALSYTRAAESEADADAIAMLRRAGIDPAGTARAFDRLRAIDLDVPSFARSHPPSLERSRLFAGSRRAGVAYRPALDAAAWSTVIGGCKGGA